MKKRVCFLFLFLVSGTLVFAAGKAEEPEIKTQNDEWLLCVTKFEVNSLPPERHVIADVITRAVIEKLNGINYRTRVSEEYAYYEQTAWARAHSGAARALAAKLEERASLVFRGDPGWIYRRNLEKIDADIEKLRLELEEMENNIPLINSEPVFGLVSDNKNLTFPASPVSGNEYRFCAGRNADGLLNGSVAEFHGRLVISLKLYTIHTRSFVWEDSIIFSQNDLDSALDEITGKLLAVLSGNQSSAITITPQPQDALVLVNRSFTGRSGAEPLEYPPGRVTVSASAPGHESLTLETELLPGEHTNVEISLRPIQYMNLEISGESGARVYNGALYVGEAPLTLRLPVNTGEFIEIVSSDSSRGTAIFQTPDMAEASRSLDLRLNIPPASGYVDRSRRAFYWAWGGTWLAGIVAWVTYQTYLSASNSFSYYNLYDGSYNMNFSSSNSRMFNISMGALAVFGAALVLDVILIGRYIYNANKGAASAAGNGRR
jgi:TolB-like protein